jgi:hypothetical protein
MKCLPSTVLAVSLALAVPAFAATAAPDAATPPTAPAQGAAADAAASSSVDASAAVGMSVTDNTGAAVGQITAIAPDSTGKNMATISMGSRSFSVDANSLSVVNGTAKINATKAQIEQQLPKS